MPKRRPPTDEPTWTPNQVVANNLTRLRHRRNLTQAELARQLSAWAGKEWTEAMVAHAERSVTGNRVREFTADDLITFARALDVPVLYFLTPPPSGVFVQVPNSRITTMDMLGAVLGRPDNLAEWEALLDEWHFYDDEELPFPLSDKRRQQIRARAGEIALIRAHHIIRRHFHGDLMQLRATLNSLADLVFDVERHEVLADLDEDEQMRRIRDHARRHRKGQPTRPGQRRTLPGQPRRSRRRRAERSRRRRRNRMSRNSTAAPRKDLATGTWWFVVDIGEGPNGQRRQTKRRGFRTRKAAQEELDHIRGALRSSTYMTPKRQTVREFLEGTGCRQCAAHSRRRRGSPMSATSGSTWRQALAVCNFSRLAVLY